MVPILLGSASILAVSSNTWEALAGVAIAAALISPDTPCRRRPRQA